MPDGPAPTRRARDPEATRQGILDAAYDEFSDHGLSGARVDAIAARTRTTVRMIYYYFGSKDELYRTVLERAYAAMRAAEAGLSLTDLPPMQAIRRLVEFTFDHHEANPRFIRLVTIENIHRAEHIARSQTIELLNRTVLSSIAAVLQRGKQDGTIRADATPLAVHLLMTAFCFFRVANRHTLSVIFSQDPLDPGLSAGQRDMLVLSVLGYLRPKPA